MGMEGEEAMPWKEMDAMSLRKEFVVLAAQAGSNIRELCRRYRVSSRTAYKWIKRYRQEGEAGLANPSKRPRHLPALASGAGVREGGELKQKWDAP
jgi:transposase